MTLGVWDVAWLVLLVVVIVVLSRLTPLRGARRTAATVLRAAGVVCAMLALKGCVTVHRQEQPRHVVYLVDQSASIDAGQTQWLARRLASLEAVRPPQVSRAVVAFGAQPHQLMPAGRAALGEPEKIASALASASLDRSSTNVETALLASVSAMPRQQRNRVILLSDGRQTAGDVERILSALRRLNVEVYPVTVPAGSPSGFVWEELAVPSAVRRGASVPMKLLVRSSTPHRQPLDVTVSLRGLPITRRRVSLAPGWQVVSLSVPALKTGTMALDVSVSSGSQQQRRSAFVEVEGPPRLLCVLDKPTVLPVLGTALKHRDMDVAVATTRELPQEAGQLLDYDAVVLYHLAKSSLTEPQVAALKEYVERFGGGVVMVGLGGRLDQEIQQQAPLDALLPVVFEPKGVQEAKRRVCMLMLIDRSASMMGPRIAATKRAAVELVKQLAPEDLVGVLAFDTQPYIVVEVQPAGQVTDVLVEKLVRLKSTGGTDVLPALRAAKTRLEATGATVQHIILLSDGLTPFDAPAYKALMGELTQQHVTISTIGIGAAFVNTDFLNWLSLSTGGTFYQMRNLNELPQLIARDTQKTLGELPFTEGYFRPTAPQPSEWFEGITDWPPLKGYLTTTAKPGAHVELSLHQADSEDPLLARWDVGLGRVAVFTSDADTRWSPEWIRWPKFEAVWAEAMRQLVRPQPSEELFLWVDEEQQRPHVVLEGAVADPSAELVSEDGHTMPLALVQLSPFRWRAPVDQMTSGWYQVVVRAGRPGHAPAGQEGSRGQTLLVRRWVQIGRAPSGPEQPHLPPDEALMRRLAEATQGATDAPDAAFLPPTERREETVPIRSWLLPLALLFLLLDVAVRGRTML